MKAYCLFCRPLLNKIIIVIALFLAYININAVTLSYGDSAEDNLIGTLYTLTPHSETFNVDFELSDNQSFIYRFSLACTSHNTSKKYSYNIKDAQPDCTYEIFAVNGDFAEFDSDTQFVKESITVREYIERNIIYDDNADKLYKIIASGRNCEFYSLFDTHYTDEEVNDDCAKTETDGNANIIAICIISVAIVCSAVIVFVVFRKRR